jgi:copper chaperone
MTLPPLLYDVEPSLDGSRLSPADPQIPVPGIGVRADGLKPDRGDDPAIRTLARYTPAGYTGETERRYRIVETRSFTVPDMTCGHCKQAVTEEVSRVAGVRGVEVDLDTKLVLVRGEALDDGALREAIEEAGYEVA